MQEGRLLINFPTFRSILCFRNSTNECMSGLSRIFVVTVPVNCGNYTRCIESIEQVLDISLYESYFPMANTNNIPTGWHLRKKVIISNE